MGDDGSIIIKRVKKYNAGHHGGAWKVAFADFAVAMMAFFLVLWLINVANEDQKQAIAGYFQDPIGFADSMGSRYVIDLGGSPAIANNPSQRPTEPTDRTLVAEDIERLADIIEQQRLNSLLELLKDKVESSQTLTTFKDQLIIDITSEGLRIQIIDKARRPMFDSGQAELKYYFEDILYELASVIATVPNKISVTGHTDSTPFSLEEFSNWELSANRANAARRALVDAGYPIEQVGRVVGLADTFLFDKQNPQNPVNRRIAIIVLNKDTEKELQRNNETTDTGDVLKQDDIEPVRALQERASDILESIEQNRQDDPISNPYDSPPEEDGAFWDE